jgi:hypothetical protein
MLCDCLFARWHDTKALSIEDGGGRDPGGGRGFYYLLLECSPLICSCYKSLHPRRSGSFTLREKKSKYINWENGFI